MAKKTECDLSSALNSIMARLDPDQINMDPNILISLKLHKAQKQLKTAKREADKLWQKHLDTLLSQAVAANHQKQMTAMKYLIRAERNRLCYAQFRQHTKPKPPGSLAYVTVCDAQGTQQPLLDRDELETTLLEHSRTHFAQAEGSPFTTKPLSCILQYDGLTLFGDCLMKGHLTPNPYQFNEPTTAILNNLKWKTLTTQGTTIALDHAMLLQGIKKWPERTMTSPSGRHLGIYKALGKHVVETKKKEQEPPLSTPINNGSLMQQGHNILYMIFDLMSIALNHTYPLK